MPLSNYTKKALLDHFFNVTVFTAPTVYLGMSSTQPSSDGTNVTEPVGNGYARTVVSTALWAAATSNAVNGLNTTNNNGTIQLATATGTWFSGAIAQYLVFYDALTNGNLLGWSSVSNAQPIVFTEAPIFTVNQIAVSLQ